MVQRKPDQTVAPLLVHPDPLGEPDLHGGSGAEPCARPQPAHLRLSEREFQIFSKLVVGRSVTEIADDLCLSSKTVSTYRARVLEKMGFRTNADLTQYAVKNNLIP